MTIIYWDESIIIPEKETLANTPISKRRWYILGCQYAAPNCLKTGLICICTLSNALSSKISFIYHASRLQLSRFLYLHNCLSVFRMSSLLWVTHCAKEFVKTINLDNRAATSVHFREAKWLQLIVLPKNKNVFGALKCFWKFLGGLPCLPPPLVTGMLDEIEINIFGFWFTLFLK